MSYIENPIVQGDNFASIRGNINENDTYFKESIDDLYASIDNSIIFGVYVGNGNEIRDINIGARPVAVEIYLQNGGQVWQSSSALQCRGGLAIDGFPCMRNKDYISFEITETGFRVHNNNNNSNNKIQINTKDITYYYKAYIRGQINS